MTRQKKEIMKKIDEIEMEIAVDQQLSFGMAPAEAYDKAYQQIWELNEELARLRHYPDAWQMINDNRGYKLEPLPFM